MKFKGGDLVTGIMWGVVAHVALNVVLPQLKTINLTSIFQQANATETTTNTTVTPPATTPTEEEPEGEGEGEEEEMEGEGEEEMEGEGEEEEAATGEEYDEGEDAAGDEEYEEPATGGGALGSGRTGSRRGRGGGSQDIIATYARGHIGGF